MPIEDDSSKKLSEIEDYRMKQPALCPEERTVVQHFESSHSRDSHSRFIDSFPQKSGVKVLGESKTQAEEGFKLKRQSYM